MADTPTVVQAWSAVMEDVQAIKKGERNKSQNFNFRGIDTVMNAVGPVLRKHNVVIVPMPEDITLSTYQTDKGTTMHSAVVKMRYTIIGPDGDTIYGGAYGEAADAGDKAVSKAESVAYRVFLLQGLTIPTDEADPDAESHQRAASPAPTRSDEPASVAVSNFIEAANNLPSAKRKELRALLTSKGLPSSPAAMSDGEAAQALVVLNEMLAGEAA